MEYLRTQTLILSVWHHDTFGRNSFLGEVDVDLSKWDFDHARLNHLALKPKVKRGTHAHAQGCFIYIVFLSNNSRLSENVVCFLMSPGLFGLPLSHVALVTPVCHLRGLCWINVQVILCQTFQTPILTPSEGRGEMRLAIRYLPQIIHSEGLTSCCRQQMEIFFF